MSPGLLHAVETPIPAAPDASATLRSSPPRRRTPPWHWAVAAGAVAASVAAVWVTLDADFLAHPGWLAVQKADFILGPALIGLYWIRRRPQSRFGPVLLAFAVVGALYVLQSSSHPWLFGAGLAWEIVIGFATYVLILAFPTGRLDRPARLILLVAFLTAVVPAMIILLLSPQIGAGRTISACRAACPENALALTSDPALALELSEFLRYAVIAVALATGALLVRRLVTGTPPQRRARSVGTALALLFLALQVTFHVVALVAPETTSLQGAVAWSFVGAGSAIWYGFVLALVVAELFAARALQGLLERSLRGASDHELEAMLREPLGDPDLRLRFWHARTGVWADVDDGDGSPELPRPGSGREVTVVQRDGRPRSPSSTTPGSTTIRSCCGPRAPSPSWPRSTASSTRRGRRRCRRSGNRARGSSAPATPSGASSSAISTTACSSGSSR
jgi:hypothetical protein